MVFPAIPESGLGNAAGGGGKFGSGWGLEGVRESLGTCARRSPWDSGSDRDFVSGWRAGCSLALDMPIDHGNEDFQSQNFQLAGEDRNKLSNFLPVVLDLSSTAAASCSTSMEKNVWSEATSSESVEMLLQSVGEEDMMNKRMDAIYSEYHNGDGLNNVNGQLGSCNTEDDSFQSEEDKAISVNPMPLHGEYEKDLSSNKNASSVVPNVPHMSDTLNNEESESRVFEILHDVSRGGNTTNLGKVVAEQCALGEVFNSPSVESFVTKEKISDNNGGEMSNDGNSKDEFLKMDKSNDHAVTASSVAEESRDAFVVQIDLTASSVTTLAHDIDESSTEKFCEHLLERYGYEVFHVKSQTLEDDAHKIGSPTLSRISDFAMPSTEGNTVEKRPKFLESSPNLDNKVETLALSMEGDDGFGDFEDDGLLDNAAHRMKVVRWGNGVDSRTPTIVCKESHLVTENQANIDRHSVEVSNKKDILSTFIDSLEYAKEASGDTSVVSDISLRNHLMHDPNLVSKENSEISGDCEGRQLEPASPTGNKKADCNHPAENRELVGAFTSNTQCGMQETDRKGDNNLRLIPSGHASQCPKFSRIQKSLGDGVLENDGRILSDTVNGPREIVEADHSSGPCVEHCEKMQISLSQHARPLNSCDETVQSDGSDSNIYGHVKGPPTRVTTQVESGVALNLKEATIQSLGLPGSSSEPCSLDGDDCGAGSWEPSCGSPIVIRCTEPCSDDLHRQELKKGLFDSDVPSLGNLPQISGFHKSSEVNKYTVFDVKENISQEDRSFTSEVGSLPDASLNEASGQWKPLSSMQPSELKQDEEGCPTKSGLRKANLKVLKGTPSNIHTPAELANKNTQKDKSKAVSRRLPERSTTSKRKSVKESLLVTETEERDGKPCSTPINKISTMNKPVQPEEIHQHSHSESNSVKPFCSSYLQTSKLPDSNTAMGLFHQPFTDKQHMQLHAQIFIYGSLIQGTPPDEACMISAFGNSDGNKCAWEGVWRTAVERFLSQRSKTTNSVTLPYSRPGIEAHEQNLKSSSDQSKTHGFSVSQTSKGNPPVTFSSPVSLPSQLLYVSTSQDVHQLNVSKGPFLDSNVTISPSHVSHSSHGKQYAGIGNPWLSQASQAFPIPAVASSQTSVLDGVHFPKVPLSETFQVTPIRNSSVSYCSNLQLKMPSFFSTTGIPSIPPALTTAVETTEKTEFSAPERHATTTQKVRRKKNVVSEMPAMLIPHSQPHKECDSTTAAARHPSTAIAPALTTALTTAVETTEKTEFSAPERHATTTQKVRRKKNVVSEMPAMLIPHSQPHKECDSTTAAARHPSTAIATPTVFPVAPSAYFSVTGGNANEQDAVAPEEKSCNTVRAKIQAEDAAAVAAAAVRHSEGVWSQLSAKKNSRLVSEIEMSLAFAAVAAAAASSVAKAAAAAAKVASDAALQAKLIADEAITNRKENCTQHSETVCIGGGSYLNGVTLVSILKGKDENRNATSLIAVAKENVRRRVEAASAAVKHAESLEIIVKAAELAAVAVSQARSIMAMGEPLPFTLNDLMEASPEGYQKFQNAIAVMHKKQRDLMCDAGLKKSLPHLLNASLNEKHYQNGTSKRGKSSSEKLKQSAEIQNGAVELLPFDISAPDSEKDQKVANLEEKSIDEGSVVEVLSNDLRRVWYSANVLNLKDAKALVCYNEHPNAGSDKLKEWIPLEGECDKPPRIRIAHPTTAVKYEGTRKRKRAAIGNYVWAIGDQVDARVHNGWREGIVTEKSKEDETKLTVNFPAGGDTLVISVWHLRPSLIWKDDHWVEWSRPRENTLHPKEGPQDKRQKWIRIEIENDNEVAKADINEHSADLQIDNSRKPKESRPQVLSDVREESKSDTSRIKRIGLQKEGSRVVFGIPRPGKKRKFMDVSKHYVKEKSDNVIEGSDSIKDAKYLVPQTPREWKNSKTEPKGRQSNKLKPKVARSSSIKFQSLQSKSAADGESSFLSTVPTSDSVETASHEENSEKNRVEAASISNDFEAEENISEPPLPPSGIVSSKKKMNFAVRQDVDTEERAVPSLEKYSNDEKHSDLADHPGETVSDAVEPRRSSRRIHPTSRAETCSEVWWPNLVT
ncbi:hypothetical protein Taro_047515 [Colocasia esculenta]|uniref:Agenet domain-containing protein n=1 Tax=Colocasia esculenta TaxID=4460 RepID=A0A843X5I5_COLES|nr:hypothetical protein [Colocasia esculenta]